MCINFANRLDSIAGTFDFNIEPFLRISNRHPLKYVAKYIKFRTKDELETYIAESCKDKKLLCYENITSQYEGSFRLTIPGDDKLKTPQGFAIIREGFKNSGVKEEEYLLGYSPNFKNPSLLEYVIFTSKVNYDRFNLSEYAKGKWEPTEIKLLTYWLK
jgi:hypothetical protein